MRLDFSVELDAAAAAQVDEFRGRAVAAAAKAREASHLALSTLEAFRELRRLAKGGSPTIKKEST